MPLQGGVGGEIALGGQPNVHEGKAAASGAKGAVQFVDAAFQICDG